MSASPARGIAFFDLDHTLVDGDSDTSFLDYLVEKGVVPREALDDKSDIHEAYMQGQPWQAEYRTLVAHVWGGLDVRAIEDLAQRHADERVLPILFAGARALIEWERPVSYTHLTLPTIYSV